MSPDHPTRTETSAPEAAPARRRTVGARIAHGIAWTVGGLALLLVILFGLFAWYSTTGDFQRRATKEIVSVLENATGGRVELGGFHFSLWHLTVEADNLVIHGLEGPGEAPYLSAARVLVQVKIISFFQHTTGTGIASHIGLNLLRVENPGVHLIIDKNGKTNQPVPKHPSTSTEPVQDTLLDLKATQMQLVNGIALINDRAIPFNADARNLEAEVHYIQSSDRYGFTVSLADLRTQMQAQPVAQSQLRLSGELGRDMAQLTSFEFDSGAASRLQATALVQHLAAPMTWQVTLKGSLDLKQLSVLTAVEGLTAGSLDLDVNGHSCAVSPKQAQTHPTLLQRLRPRTPARPNTVPLPPDPECQQGYLVVGTAKLHNAGYNTEYVHLNGINGGAQLHITPSALLFSALSGYLPGGGSAAGELRIVNWLGETTPTAPASSPTAKAAVETANKTAVTAGKAPTATPTVPPVLPAHAYLVATVNSIPLRTIMEATETKTYRDIGFDTAVSGPVKAEWGGPATDIADTVTVDGDLTFRPTGVARRGVQNVPITGVAKAHYDGKREVVNIERVNLTTLDSSLNASGVLGVNLGDPLTNLNVDLIVHHLSEFDQLLQSLDFEANGKKGAAAIPVVLHGAVSFQGTVSGRAANLDAKGHLQGNNLEVHLGDTLDTQIDSIVTDAEYSFESGLAVANSTIKRNTAVLNVAGTVKPRRVTPRRGPATVVWDDGAAIAASVKLANASVPDLLQIAGQQDKYPVTGTININTNVNGTLKNLNGGGSIDLTNGSAYGEPYTSLLVDLAVQGQDVEASKVALTLSGMQITANGGYDLGTKHFHGHVQGNNLVLAKFHTFAQKAPNINATLNLSADANGTAEQPGLSANLRLTGLALNGKQLGELGANVFSKGSLVSYTVQSNVIGAQLNLTGSTQLTGNYQTQDKLTLTGLDLATASALFSPGTSLKAQSTIGGTVNISGPAKTPQALTATAEFPDFDVKLQGIELKTPQPIRLALNNGVVTVEQLHITGQDTDLQASGTAQVFGATGANGGALNIKANGGMDMAIIHVLDPDVLSSGKVTFEVAAGGAIKKPALTGRVLFNNVNAAMDGIPNGLTALNGSLVFNEDRLNVENLTATTGGGKLAIGGFLTYNNGIYADLTATGNTVRVRMYGLSSTANANLHLQGGPQSLLLSGNILITRFDVGPNVDFAAFSSNNGGLSAPPDPSAASNKVRLDVHVTSSPQLDFQNSYAKLAGTVDLTVRGTVAEPTILGRIEVTDGSATFNGTKYQLERGDIYFTNPVRIDPVVDIEATARVETYDITIGLNGTASNLRPTYRSEPPLSEADIFNLLALGRTQEEAQINNELQTQQGTDPTTSALLGGALNATVGNRISKLFGGGSIKIEPAFVGTLGNSSARITLQQQLTSQLSFTYATNVNSTAQQLLEGEFDFTPNVSVVVQRDESGVFSMVYRIRRRYR